MTQADIFTVDDLAERWGLGFVSGLLGGLTAFAGCCMAMSAWRRS